MKLQHLFAGSCIAVLMAGCTTMPTAPVETLAQRRAASDYTPTTEAIMKKAVANRKFASTPLSLKNFHVTFNDDFNHMSVTDNEGRGPWYSPVHDSFGSSQFVAPQQGKGPVFVRDGKLVIQLYDDNGQWISSNIQTTNSKGQGFAQQYGYFEMRAKFPPGAASWPGFWLHSHPALTGPGVPQTEIDIIEAYGGDPKGYHTTLHIWPTTDPMPGDITKQVGLGSYTKVTGMFEDYHTYGVLITPENMIFYYDRKEVVRMPTLPEFKTPQYMLIDLAMLPRFKNYAKGMMEMNVDYVRVWQSNDNFKSITSK